jgi:hypothetical protein
MRLTHATYLTTLTYLCLSPISACLQMLDAVCGKWKQDGYLANPVSLRAFMVTGRARPVLFNAVPLWVFTPAGDSGVIFRLWPVSSLHQSWTLCDRTQQCTRSVIVIYELCS